MPERIDLNIPVRQIAPRAQPRHIQSSDAFANALKKHLNASSTNENAELFSDLLARLEFAETDE